MLFPLVHNCVQMSTVSPQTHILIKHRMEPHVTNTANSTLHKRAMRTVRGDAAVSAQTS